MENRACALRGEALAPVVGREAPGYFDRRHEGGFEGRGVEADVADEGSRFDELGGVGAEAAKFEVEIDAGDEGVGFLRGEGGGVVLHDAGVGVDGLEREAVGFAPGAEG